MPFSSGTAKTPTVLLNAINTHLTANGWTKLFGNTNMGTDSPQSARYWRLLWGETEATTVEYRSISDLQFRTAVGGANVATTAANLTASHISDDPVVDWGLALSGTQVDSIDIDNEQFWLMYDFGTPTVIREVSMTMPADSRAPLRPCIQFSDDALTWNTMYVPQVNLSWDDNETKVFTFDDGYRDPTHPDTNCPRRKGYKIDSFGPNQGQLNQTNQQCEGWWCWEGPGYDATRRVYIQAFPHSVEASDTHHISWKTSVGWDYDNLPYLQEGQNSFNHYHLMDSGEVDYWIYSNSIRLILVTRSGVGDYTSSYIGFMAAFGQPEEYSNPLFVGSTTTTINTSTTVNSGLSGFFDPGSAEFRDWQGNWNTVSNRDSVANAEDDYTLSPSSVVYPWHYGYLSTSDNYPNQLLGNDGADGNHWLDHVVAGPNGELPIIAACVINETYGVVGVLDGVYAIPGGNVLAAEQIITIDSQDYKIFPNRDRRQGHHWVAIRED